MGSQKCVPSFARTVSSVISKSNFTSPSTITRADFTRPELSAYSQAFGTSPLAFNRDWPLPDDVQDDPVKMQEARLRRYQLVDTLGNLTLITHSLNPSLSNSAWETKRPELLKFSKLNLTRYFYDDANAKAWDEGNILARGASLAQAMMAIWPDVVRATQVEVEPA